VTLLTAPFADPLAGRAAELLRGDGTVVPLDVGRWHATADGEDQWLLARCRGTTIDLGCGPGRLVVALAARGTLALGVDLADEAVVACRRRGVHAVQADVFGLLPGEGAWDHVLLADGNIGIGGDPVRLLRRSARVARPGGTVLVELEAGDGGLWRGEARLRCDGILGPPFPWATVGSGALPRLASAAGLRVVSTYRGRRRFAELVDAGDAGAAPALGGGTGADAT
jgi:SAM-dependent methyltransferase